MELTHDSCSIRTAPITVNSYLMPTLIPIVAAAVEAECRAAGVKIIL
jgi:hypothetical protein